jgi:hypothetical protein
MNKKWCIKEGSMVEKVGVPTWFGDINLTEQFVLLNS